MQVSFGAVDKMITQFSEAAFKLTAYKYNFEGLKVK